MYEFTSISQKGKPQACSMWSLLCFIVPDLGKSEHLYFRVPSTRVSYLFPEYCTLFQPVGEIMDEKEHIVLTKYKQLSASSRMNLSVRL